MQTNSKSSDANVSLISNKQQEEDPLFAVLSLKRMEEIRDIIDKIVRGCSKCSVEIDDVLAAFVARTVSD